MKTKLLLFFILISPFVFSQKNIPNLPLENLKGERISAKQLLNANGPTIISFWATWCKPCLKELDSINQEISKWKTEKNIRFIAISVDDTRSKARVPAMVKNKDWQWEIFYDTNADFQRAMNVLNVPHTFIFDKNGTLLHQQNSFALGNEIDYWEILNQ